MEIAANPGVESVAVASWLGGKCDDVVELSLLVPTAQVRRLLGISRLRGQTVAEVLRDLIKRELEATESH